MKHVSTEQVLSDTNQPTHTQTYGEFSTDTIKYVSKFVVANHPVSSMWREFNKVLFNVL